ncbi:rhomboid family intramembrane serine protease [Paraburkholderia sp. Ac-20336]|uniref:rhomboid family intramembrane serine protease n=1 Tax=Paraburkholderia sp. Ac-20336 TaxID=2703886 RepID=UPI00197DCA24|nr:rhomboid family intramembrane serine protease [Paraburkholderia sp. Ac-20336]MBN3806425.1 rhomboid family intramembrane serine protease [Paraburkholderia sp. Ac-20336]
MDRVEPHPGASGHASGMPPAAFSVFADWDSAATFKLRYSVRPKNWHLRWNPLSALHHALRIKGELSIRQERVVLRRASGRQQYDFHRDEIYDIEFDGRQLCFDLRAGSRDVRRVALTTGSLEDVQQIVGLLPAQMTPAFAAERRALNTINYRLAALTPHLWVTYALIVLNLVVFMAMYAAGADPFKPHPSTLLDWGANFAPDTLSGEPWRLVSALFVHAGLAHLVSNMLVLYALGRLTERLYGNARFLALYLFAGLSASMFSIFVHPALSTVGASGAIFGVAGALLVYVLRYRKELPKTLAERNRSAMWVFILFNLYSGLVHRGVDNAAHVGGLIGGMLIGALLARPLEPVARERRSRTSLLASTLVGGAALGAFAYPLTHMSAARLEDAQFEKVLFDMHPAQLKALADLDAWRHMRMASQVERDVASNRLITDILPEWDALYTAIDHAKLPPRSPRTAMRTALLRYLDDNRQIFHREAVLLTHPQETDDATQAPIRALAKDARDQIDLVTKLSHGRVVRPPGAERKERQERP